jgi:hypothetical protein
MWNRASFDTIYCVEVPPPHYIWNSNVVASGRLTGEWAWRVVDLFYLVCLDHAVADLAKDGPVPDSNQLRPAHFVDEHGQLSPILVVVPSAALKFACPPKMLSEGPMGLEELPLASVGQASLSV